jgi:large subunit ribosomal protein L11
MESWLNRGEDRDIEEKMSVSLVRKVRLRVGAGVAKPGPAIGQALGPLGLNMAEFCKQFNEKTKLYEKDTPIPVDLSAFSNRSFTFVVKSPPTSWFLKKCAGVELGSARYAQPPSHSVSSSSTTSVTK